MTNPDKLPEEQLTEVRADIDRQRQYAGPLLKPVWDVLARLARILAALGRRSDGR